MHWSPSRQGSLFAEQILNSLTEIKRSFLIPKRMWVCVWSVNEIISGMGSQISIDYGLASCNVMSQYSWGVLNFGLSKITYIANLKPSWFDLKNIVFALLVGHRCLCQTPG